MYFQKEIIANISKNIIFSIINNKFLDILPSKIKNAEMDIAFILLCIWKNNREIDYNTEDLIRSKKINNKYFSQIRHNILTTWMDGENKDVIYNITAQILNILLKSCNIDEIYVDNNILQNKINKILIENLLITSEVNRIVTNKLTGYKKGTSEWEIIYSRLVFVSRKI